MWSYDTALATGARAAGRSYPAGDPGFEPAAIARRHLELLHQPPGQWTAEILHSGDTSTP